MRRAVLSQRMLAEDVSEAIRVLRHRLVSSPISLRTRYAMSGTDVPYDPTRTPAPPPYRPTRFPVLIYRRVPRNVQY
eukprot:190225-Rhodomonas_salina.1